MTLLLLGVLAGYSFFKNGIVPIARVEGDIIFLNEVESNIEVSRRAWEETPELRIDDDLSGLFGGSQEELFRSALESVIVTKIITSRASNEEKNEASRRLEAYIGDNHASLSASAEDAFGWSAGTLKERVLYPQVLQEVLAETKGEGYTRWLEEARASSDVSIWFVPFSWGEGSVVRD
jgi:hypothetical protein